MMRTVSLNSYSAELEGHVDSCPCCQGRKWSLFATCRRSNGDLKYQICERCGLIFQSPQMSEAQLTEFYATSYRLFAFGQVAPPKVDLDIQDGRAQHLARLMKDRNSGLEGQEHLDIGCGSGALMRRLQELCGCHSAGIEPDDSYREFARSRGLEVYGSLNEWRAAVGTRVKFVTLSHVLEHVPDPMSLLVQIRKEVLWTDGLLLVEVPHLYFHPYFDLAHVLAFSPHSFRQILRMAGYDVLSFKQHGAPVRFTPRYMTILAAVEHCGGQSAMILRGEPRAVKLKRSAGLLIDSAETGLLRMVKRVRNLARRWRMIRA